MRFVHSLGLAQVILPPPLRPNMALLERFGVSLDEAALEEAGPVIRSAYSASTMWSANAATVSPAPDTADGVLHLTIANLGQQPAPLSGSGRAICPVSHHFGAVARVHEALPAATPFTDEGAANHMRLSPAHGAAGVEIFIYGRDDDAVSMPKRFPARQTRRASAAIAALHRLPEERLVLAQQHPAAIDAGVFHNDVIAMSNGAVMIYHELTFLDEDSVLEELKRKAAFPLTLIRLGNDVLPIGDAVASYFFNSQLLTLPGGGMVVVAPSESRDNEAARIAFDRLVQAEDNPIEAVHYLDVRESMQNGGGPACLRLRVVMPEADVARIPEPYRFSEARFTALSAFIAMHTPKRLRLRISLVPKQQKHCMRCMAD